MFEYFLLGSLLMMVVMFIFCSTFKGRYFVPRSGGYWEGIMEAV